MSDDATVPRDAPAPASAPEAPARGGADPGARGHRPHRARRLARGRLPGREARLPLREVQGARGRHDGHPPQRDHRPDRPLGLRQVDLPALPQPDERPHPRHQGRRHAPLPRPGPLLVRRRRGGRAPAYRHGLPEAQPVPQVDQGQHRLRPQGQRHEGQRRQDRGGAAPRRPLGRGQGQAQAGRLRAVRAASSSGSASRAPSPSSPRSCSWTSPARRSTRSRRWPSRT